MEGRNMEQGKSVEGRVEGNSTNKEGRFPSEAPTPWVHILNINEKTILHLLYNLSKNTPLPISVYNPECYIKLILCYVMLCYKDKGSITVT